MKLKILLEKLSKLDPECDVAGYSEPGEDTFLIDKVKVITKETQPYDKGEGIYDRGNKLTENVVLLSGY